MPWLYSVRTTRRDPQDTDAVEIPLYVVHTLLFTRFDIINCIIKVHYVADNA